MTSCQIMLSLVKHAWTLMAISVTFCVFFIKSNPFAPLEDSLVLLILREPSAYFVISVSLPFNHSIFSSCQSPLMHFWDWILLLSSVWRWETPCYHRKPKGISIGQPITSSLLGHCVWFFRELMCSLNPVSQREANFPIEVVSLSKSSHERRQQTYSFIWGCCDIIACPLSPKLDLNYECSFVVFTSKYRLKAFSVICRQNLPTKDTIC